MGTICNVKPLEDSDFDFFYSLNQLVEIQIFTKPIFRFLLFFCRGENLQEDTRRPKTPGRIRFLLTKNPPFAKRSSSRQRTAILELLWVLQGIRAAFSHWAMFFLQLIMLFVMASTVLQLFSLSKMMSIKLTEVSAPKLVSRNFPATPTSFPANPSSSRFFVFLLNRWAFSFPVVPFFNMPLSQHLLPIIHVFSLSICILCSIISSIGGSQINTSSASMDATLFAIMVRMAILRNKLLSSLLWWCFSIASLHMEAPYNIIDLTLVDSIRRLFSCDVSCQCLAECAKVLWEPPHFFLPFYIKSRIGMCLGHPV